jgi:hypothetical protein
MSSQATVTIRKNQGKRTVQEVSMRQHDSNGHSVNGIPRAGFRDHQEKCQKAAMRRMSSYTYLHQLYERLSRVPMIISESYMFMCMIPITHKPWSHLTSNLNASYCT